MSVYSDQNLTADADSCFAPIGRSSARQTPTWMKRPLSVILFWLRRPSESCYHGDHVLTDWFVLSFNFMAINWFQFLVVACRLLLVLITFDSILTGSRFSTFVDRDLEVIYTLQVTLLLALEGAKSIAPPLTDAGTIILTNRVNGAKSLSCICRSWTGTYHYYARCIFVSF